MSAATIEQKPVLLRHVLLLGGLTAFGPLSTDLYLPALPTVSTDLGASMALVQFTLTICILGLALGQLIIGPLSDMRGRRWPLLMGIIGFILTSLLCSIAPSIMTLSVFRFVQGLSSAAGMVIALAIARDLYDGKALARCIAMLMGINFLAPIAAPLLGGQLLQFSGWRGLFIFLAVIGVLFFLVSFYVLPESLAKEARQQNGIGATLRALRVLLTTPRFMGYALACGFTITAGIVYISASPFVLQGIYGLTPQHFSFVFGVNAIGLALMAQLSARLITRVSPHMLLVAGTLLLACAGVGLLIVVLTNAGLIGVLAAFFTLTLSLGLIMPNGAALALADIDAQNAGSASALLGVLQLIIGAIIAPLVGLAGDSSALPMAITIAIFAFATLLTVGLISRGNRMVEQTAV